MATSERWKDADGNPQEKTEWHNIVAWRKLAEICGQYLKKGGKVYLEGKLQTRSWDDKNTGVKKYMTEIVVDDMIMLDSKGQGADISRGAPRTRGSRRRPGPLTRTFLSETRDEPVPVSRPAPETSSH